MTNLNSRCYCFQGVFRDAWAGQVDNRYLRFSVILTDEGEV